MLAEPPREFDAISFWLKMSLVALMVVIALSFQRSVRRHDQAAGRTASSSTGRA